MKHKTSRDAPRSVARIATPIGRLAIVATANGVSEILFDDDDAYTETHDDNPMLAIGVPQLEEYFSGKRRSFDIPLDLQGTPFQLAVWRTLLLIPCGATWSYGKVATHIGRSKAVRAVGGANHRNPVSVVVPCHRVVGSDGSLTGYGGGLWRKEWLLKHEADM